MYENWILDFLMYANPGVWRGLFAGLSRTLMSLRKTVEYCYNRKSAGLCFPAAWSQAPYESQIWTAEKLLAHGRPWNSGESLCIVIWDIHHLHQQYLKCKTIGIFWKYLIPFSISVYLCPGVYLYLKIPPLRIVFTCGCSHSSGVSKPIKVML